MLKELKSFLLRGNIVDLAVAVIIGGAFGKIVTSLVEDVITPLIGLIGGEPNFEGIVLFNAIKIGSFINAIVNFVIIGTVLFFILKAINKATALTAKKEAEKEAAVAAPTSEELLTEIRDLLKNK